MGDLEVMTLVDSKPTAGMIVARYVLIALTALCVGGMFLIPVIFMMPAVILGIITYFVITGQRIEYEYTYYDGELRIAKIKAKRKRKELVRADIDDVLVLAPEGSDALRPYSNQNPNAERCKVLNYSSHVKGNPYYVLVYRKDKEVRKVYFEPEEKIVQGMRSRDMRKVTLAK